MNDCLKNPPPGEAMIDARQACFALRLPYYWFADPKMRAAKRIPHYQLSRLIRFRLSELADWQQRNAGRIEDEPLPGGAA